MSRLWLQGSPTYASPDSSSASATSISFYLVVAVKVHAALTALVTLRAAESCSEFLVHGVDVEGKQLGIDEELVELLGKAAPLPVTYAGGVRSLVRPCLLFW